MPIGKNSIARAAKITEATEKKVNNEENAPVVIENVLANVSPEVVEKVAGIKENDPDAPKTEIVQILGKMPDFLL